MLSNKNFLEVFQCKTKLLLVKIAAQLLLLRLASKNSTRKKDSQTSLQDVLNVEKLKKLHKKVLTVDFLEDRFVPTGTVQQLTPG